MGPLAEIQARTLVNACTSSSGVTAGGTGASLTVAQVPDTRYGVRNGLRLQSGSGQAAHLDFATNFEQIGPCIDVLIYLSSPSAYNASYITGYSSPVFLTPDAFTSYKQWNTYIRAGWNYLRIPLANPGTAPTGTPDLDGAIDIMRVRVAAITSQVSDAYVCGIWTGGYNRPIVTHDFDDGYTEVHTNALPVFDELGIVGNVGVITSLIGGAGKMGMSQLRELAAEGWRLIGHTHTHSASIYSAGSVSAIYEDLKPMVDIMGAEGWDWQHLVVPFGQWSPNLREVCDQLGIVSIRGLWYGAGTDNIFVNSPYSADRLYHTGFSPARTTAVANIENHLNWNINMGGALRYVWHKPKTGASEDVDYELATWQAFFRSFYRQRMALLNTVDAVEYWDSLLPAA